MPQKDNNVCEIHSFFLAWTRCTCLQESLMAQFEAQDILISVIAYIKDFRDVTVVLELTSVCFVQAYLAKKNQQVLHQIHLNFIFSCTVFYYFKCYAIGLYCLPILACIHCMILLQMCLPCSVEYATKVF